MTVPRVELPILVIAPNTRGVGVVLLDRRLEPLDARIVTLRRCESSEAKAEQLARCLDRLVARHGVRTVVVEKGGSDLASADRDVLEVAALKRAEDIGVRTERVSFRASAHRISDGTLMGTARVLARRYDRVRIQYGPVGPCRFLKTDRERNFRPLIVALAIAHACGLESFKG